MAARLSRIIGTEEDKVNCPFYYKIGACRHGDRCSRTHLRPNFSQSLIIPHLYIPPPPGPDGAPADDTEVFFDFYDEILEELSKFGEIEELHVLENLGDHMFGNVYVKYHKEEEAEKCMNSMRGRYYAGRMVQPEYSTVTDFREARCRQFDETACARGGYCNFAHMKYVPSELRRKVRKLAKKARESGRERSRSRGRDRSRSRGKDRDRKRSSRSRDRDGKDKDKDERRRSKGREKDVAQLARSSSEERRAKIAEWNKARTAPAGPAGDGQAAGGQQ